ncbi:hypothetical protein ACWKSP_28015 [Micromonosporaceae bacterium Da 78-11]
MSIGSPQDAPPRTDLPFLRHRRRPTAVPPSPLPLEPPAAPLLLSPPAAPLVPGPSAASLDLGSPLFVPKSGPVSASPAAARPRVPPVRRAAPDRPATLTPQQPTVVLTRIQSAVGALRIEGRWAAPAKAWLIVAYQPSTGENRILPPHDALFADADGILADHRGRHPRITVDLLHIRRLDRLLIATTTIGAPAPLTGAVVLTTHGGTRIDLPVDLPPEPGVAALLTAYIVDGQLVLRAERDPVGGPLRDVCLAYGYDRITWVDPYTPLT